MEMTRVRQSKRIINKSLRNARFVKFQNKAHAIHKHKYDYSKATYTNSSVKISIVCPVHGIFHQTPSSHARGKGCPACGKIQRYNTLRKTNAEFIRDARAIHSRKYRYDDVQYINSNTKVAIKCFEHGSFMQTPHSHLMGRGCPICAKYNRPLATRKSVQTFIKQAKGKHTGKYLYTLVNYTNTDTKVWIKCKTHGPFLQTPKSHLKGRGCPRCCCRGTSQAEQEWMNYLSIECPNLQHFNNKGQFRVPGTNYTADGYDEQSNTIFEFDGDFWHGNPKHYDRNALNKVSKKTFGALFDATKKKKQRCKQLGFHVVSIWHSDWKKLKQTVIMIQRKYRKTKT